MTTGRREAKKRAGVYCLITVIPLILLLLMEYIQMGEIGVQTPDAMVYLSIAENFVTTGHFMQTYRYIVTGMVVPPGVPLILTLFRILHLPLEAVIVLQIMMFCLSNILLYETEITITGRGGWAPTIYTMAYLRCWLRLGVVLVEHYFLFLMCLCIWLVFKEMNSQKKMILMNALGFYMLLCRPVTGVIYAVILTVSLIVCIQTKERKLPICFVLIPILILGINLAVNYRETGEIVFLENYSASDLYTASKPDSPVTIEAAANFMADDVYTGINWDESIPMQEKNRMFLALVRENIKKEPLLNIKHAAQRFYELFLKAYAFAALYTLMGALLMIHKDSGSRRKMEILALGLNLILAGLSSFAIPECRYSVVIWPLASIHGAFMMRTVGRWMRERRKKTGVGMAVENRT